MAEASNKSEEVIDTTNQFMVGANRDRVIVQIPVRRPLEKEEAIRLAAWLVAIADPTQKRFTKVLAAVLAT